MEDAHVAIPDFDVEKGLSLFGVFDGHGGVAREAVAKLVSERLPRTLKNLEEYKAGNFKERVGDRQDEFLWSADGRVALRKAKRKANGALLAAEAPRLRALLRNKAGRCAFSLHCKTDPIPLSAPSWATLLTGQRAAVHRITSNDLDSLLSTDSQGRLLVQPSDCLCTPVRSASCFASAFSQAKRQKLANPASPFPPTLFHFLSQNGCSAKLLNVGWPGVPQLCADARRPEFAKMHIVNSQAEELDKAVEEMLKLFVHFVQQLCLQVLALYTHSVDLAGHVHGFSLDVPEYLESIEHFDACLGRLLDALADRHEDWLLAITTDHGGGAAKDMSKDQWSLFVEDCKCIHKGLSQAGSQGVHGLQDSDTHNTRFVILSGLNARPGEICPPPEAIDFLPTLLRHLGLASDSLPGRSRGLRRD
ncbi:unnamed protein product [Durusdinium trenchii]|uniref:Protein-serine/threonine phosphatase n=1 Tax=Durusdinium trenchii TaxID=1381693 RepID=A0ABP0JQA8_9DINO